MCHKFNQYKTVKKNVAHLQKQRRVRYFLAKWKGCFCSLVEVLSLLTYSPVSISDKCTKQNKIYKRSVIFQDLQLRCFIEQFITVALYQETHTLKIILDPSHHHKKTQIKKNNICLFKVTFTKDIDVANYKTKHSRILIITNYV